MPKLKLTKSGVDKLPYFQALPDYPKKNQELFWDTELAGFGLRVNWWYDGRRDVVASTNAALNYLSYLGSFFHNNWLLAMAAYDTGEGNVQAAIDRNAHAGKSISFWSLGLPKETQNYVPKILALATIIAHPYKYPINLPYLPNAPYLSKVNIGSQIDLARAAKMAGVSLKTLTELNPGYNRWATDPRGKHFLLLPVDNAARFKRALTGLPVKDRVTWHRVKIKEGDALYDIAKQYHTSPSLIAEVNHIKNNVIRPGQSLLIPDQKSGVTKLVINSERRYFGSLHKIPEPKVVHYEVKSGESLWQIAQKYHVAASEIRFWNGLRTNHIKPGTRLTIWPPHKKVSLYYTSWPYRVRKGDSLISIAKKYHTPILLLKKSNGIKGTEIRLGQVLRIPVAHYASRPHRKAAVRHTSKAPLKNSAHSTIYKVRSGDNLYKIAEKFKTSSKKISAENHLKNNMIKPGQLLRV